MEELKIFISLWVITNPIGNIPFFISLTQHQSDAERRRTIRTAAIAVAITLVTAGLVGEKIIELFSISIDSFRVGGGILVLLTAISMLNTPQKTKGLQTDEEREEAEHKSNVAIFPLTIPLLAGPGAISTVIIHAGQANHWYEYMYLVVSGLCIGISVWGLFRLAVPISGLLGQSGINIATRVMGMLLAAIGIEFIMQGLKGLIPVLNIVSLTI